MATRPAGLPDHLAPDLRAVFVGINPGLRSAALGHHYAGHGNRFWKVLFAAGLLPEAWSWERDAEVLRLGFGLTNLVARPTRGAGDLTEHDYDRGRRALRQRLRRYRPATVVLVGITVYERIFATRPDKQHNGRRTGAQSRDLAGCPVYVVPNPSGRNAHWTPQAMVDEYMALRRWLDQHAPPRSTAKKRSR